MRRRPPCVRQLNISEQVGAGYPGGVHGAVLTSAAQRGATSPRRRPIQQNAGRYAETSTSNNSNNAGPRNTQRNGSNNYEVDRTIRHTK